MTRQLIKVLLLAFATVISPGAAHSDDWRHDDVARVVAISDVHGDFDAMVSTLKQAGILDANLAWAGGEAHFVLVGDILDRGPNSRAAMDLLMGLEGEARDSGGQVHVLIGNHESMLLTGDMRYVSDAEYAAFAADETAADRERWFDLYTARMNGDPESLRGKFDTDFPKGYFAMRRAFRPDGKYGAWLLEKNIIVVINGTAFVHGGLSPGVADIGLSGVNIDLQHELVEYVKALETLTEAEAILPTDSHYDYDAILDGFMPALGENAEVMAAAETARRLGDSVLLDTDGPLWYRRNATCPGIVESHRLEAALQAIGADRVVVGHTPTPNREVLQRFDGRLIEIDTGMLGSYYGGSGNALVLEGMDVSVVNQSGARRTVPLEHPRRVGQRASELTPLALQKLLESGEIVIADEAMSPRQLLQVSDGENTVSAVFSARKGRGFYPGVAAYRLDRLLQLDMVPVTAIRKIGGKDGSLQFVPVRSIDEVARSASGKGGGASCPMSDQWAAMYVFDVLIYNQGRTQERIWYDTSTWRLQLSEHDDAFANKKGRPNNLKSVKLPVSEGWKKALVGLSNEILEEHVGDVLDKRRLRALEARRDELLSQSDVD